ARNPGLTACTQVAWHFPPRVTARLARFRDRVELPLARTALWIVSADVAAVVSEPHAAAEADDNLAAGGEWSAAVRVTLPARSDLDVPHPLACTGIERGEPRMPPC